MSTASANNSSNGASPAIASSIDTADLGGGDHKSGAQNEEKDESPQSQAFDPETGEINWDCPCLGGMAHGTCGEEFKTAFSCFVYSKEEPKGMDCIEAFKAMQECFRAHPEEYGDELLDDEDEEGTGDSAGKAADEESGNDTDVEDIKA
ncbi:Oxidoreductase [Dipsacomyces acuminosporus]|nr:Oxidoreductase [Dipsacomyces acuminosporus]